MRSTKSYRTTRQSRFVLMDRLEPRILFSVLVVNSDADNSIPGDGLVTLREAITAANNDLATDIGHKANGADTIVFRLGPGAHTINLAGPLPDLASNVSIAGPGPGLLTVRRDSGGDYRVFTVDLGAVVSISGMTIANGSAYIGGGIFNQGTLALSACVLTLDSAATGGALFNRGAASLSTTILSSNQAFGSGGAIFNDFGGQLALADSALSGNFAFSTFGGGGAMQNAGNVTIGRCLLSGNTAFSDSGGAINLFAGTLTITDSTVTGNSAFLLGGGIANFFATVSVDRCTFDHNTAFNTTAFPSGDGGGMYSLFGNVTVADSTFDHNLAGGAGGGLYNNSGTANLVNSTFNANHAEFFGGALFNTGTLGVNFTTIAGNDANQAGGGTWSNAFLYATNSIIAGNTAAFDPDVTGLFFDFGFNFIGTRDGDPMLGPLANNGGPTHTMALLPGSPCINAGDPNFASPPLYDQRGAPFTRVFGGRVDIGAFEFRKPVAQQVAELQQQVSNLPGLDAGTITSLLAKLNLLGDPGDRGKVSALITEVGDLIKTGRLSHAAGDPVLAAAQDLLASLP